MSRKFLCCVVVVFGFLSSLRGQDSGMDLLLQVQRMQQWLAPSPHADGWRRFLLLNKLETQAVKAWRANPAVVRQVLAQFESGKPGLEHPVFQGVAKALRRHLTQLEAMPADAATALADAENAYRAITAEQIQAEWNTLLSEVRLCRNRFGSAGVAGVTTQDLRLDELEKIGKELDWTQPSGEGPNAKQQADVRALRTILLDYTQRSGKLTDRFFAVLRRHLERGFLQYSQWLQADPRAEFNQHLSRLKDHLAKITDPKERAAQGDFAAELGWLDATGHAPALVAALRADYMLPNANFSVMESFARQVAARPVNNTRPVSENILGRQIYGTATTQGQVVVDFVNDPDQAHVSLQLRGQTVSDSHTHQGPVTAYSGAYADVEVRRSILANAGGMIEYEPYGAANLSSEFRGVNCIRLVEKLAYKQYQRDKDASEAIGARRLERRLISEFGRETSQAIQNGRSRLAQAHTESDSRVGFVPPFCVLTTDDMLMGFAMKTDTFQLSAPTDPPESVKVPADVVLQLHESMLDNFLEPLLARQTIKNIEFPQKFEEWFGQKPENMPEPADDEIWGITFENSRPVQFIFDENLVGIAIAGSRFTRDELFRDPATGERKTRVRESINEPMMIKILFQMTRSGDKMSLVRHGRATVEFTRAGVKTVPQNAFRSFLEDVLNKSLREAEEAAAKPDAPQPGLRLSENLIPLDRLKDPTIAQNLKLVIFRSEAGWITAGWRNFPGLATGAAGAIPADAVDTPAIH
jgi:hypothetical protein